MNIDRRRFLAVAGVSATVSAAGLVNDRKGVASVNPDIPTAAEMSWPAVREQFDGLAADRIHMSSFFLASHPKSVREAIDKHRRGIDADPYTYIESNILRMPAALQAAAAEYLGGRPEEVAITNSTTMGLSFVYQGLPLAAGDEILTTAHDHFVHHESVRLACERSNATFRKISLFDDINKVSELDIVDRIRKAVSQKTRVLGVTWVHSSTGLKLPIREIAAAVSEINKNRSNSERIILIVDGVHGFGVEDVDIAATGVDFFIAGTHKWIFGPRGTGIIWAKEANWKRLRMVFPAFAMETFGAWASGTKLTAPMQASWIVPGGFHAFEYEWALPAAFEFHKRIGRSRVAARIHELNDQCKKGLARMRNVKLHTPLGDNLSAGLIAFDIDGMKPGEVVDKLRAKRIIASTSPYAISHARLAPSLLNTEQEVEETLRAVRDMA